MSFLTSLRHRVLSLTPEDTSFTKMGARIDLEQQPGLQAILDSARVGFNTTLEDDGLDDLTGRVAARVPAAHVGFAHEGVGMCLTLLDLMRDRQRVTRFFDRCLGTYDFFVPLGVGFALARSPWVPGGIEGWAARFPPCYEGLVLNGAGFHEACFKSKGALERTPKPRSLSPDAARCFDHGIGRATWFMCGGSPERVAASIAKFPADRQEDLWAGVGTACAFAGSAHPDPAGYASVLQALDGSVGPHRGVFQVGVVLAAELARRTRQPSRWVDSASERFLGLREAEAGALADRAWTRAHAEGAPPVPYAMYRKFAALIAEELQASGAAAGRLPA
jgi:hypothetical protein